MTENKNPPQSKLIPLSLVFLISVIALLVPIFKEFGFDVPTHSGFLLDELSKAFGAVLGGPLLVILFMSFSESGRKKGKRRKVYLILVAVFVATALFL